MNEATVTLDVREDIRAGREPFSRIMQTIAQLQGEQRLRLIAPFEPVPLFRVLAQRGFSHQAQATPSGDWEVLFTRSPDASSQEVCATSPSACAGPPVINVDARGLEPPQPLVVILEAVERLPGCAVLRARTDRRPLHLYAQLEERGCTGETEEQPDGSFITSIRRA